MFFVYMIRCEDNSLYTGITTDVLRRYREHISQGKKCAKYTLSHKAVSIEAAWNAGRSRSEASRAELFIKKLSKEKKELLIRDPYSLCEIFPEFEPLSID